MPKVKVVFLVLDADDDPDWRRLQAVSTVLERNGNGELSGTQQAGWPSLAVFRKNRFLAVRYANSVKDLLTHFNIDSVELFPKQNKLKTGPGSLVRLPFGVHRRSGNRYGFYNTQGHPIAPALSWQIMVLEDRETVPTAVFEQFRDIGSSKVRIESRFDGLGVPKHATRRGTGWFITFGTD